MREFEGKQIKSILLFGAPGSGKGTQGKALSQIPGLHHLSSGDVFRNLDSESQNGIYFDSFAGQGNLVPDDVTIRIIRENIQGRISRRDFTPNREIILLDGIPRNLNQAKLLNDDLNVIRIIYLNIHDPEVILQRLKNRAIEEGRSDDIREGIILRRLEIYHRDTKPILDHYPHDKLIEVDGGLSPASVLSLITEAIEPVINTKLLENEDD